MLKNLNIKLFKRLIIVSLLILLNVNYSFASDKKLIQTRTRFGKNFTGCLVAGKRITPVFFNSKKISNRVRYNSFSSHIRRLKGKKRKEALKINNSVLSQCRKLSQVQNSNIPTPTQTPNNTSGSNGSTTNEPTNRVITVKSFSKEKNYHVEQVFDHAAGASQQTATLFNGEITNKFLAGSDKYFFKFNTTTQLYSGINGIVSSVTQSNSDCAKNSVANEFVISIIKTVNSAEKFQITFYDLTSISVSEGQTINNDLAIGYTSECSVGIKFERIINGVSVAVDPYGWSGKAQDPYELLTGIKQTNLWEQKSDALNLNVEYYMAPNSCPNCISPIVVETVKGDLFDNTSSSIRILLDQPNWWANYISMNNVSITSNSGLIYKFKQGDMLRAANPFTIWFNSESVQNSTNFYSTNGSVNLANDCIRVINSWGLEFYKFPIGQGCN